MNEDEVVVLGRVRGSVEIEHEVGPDGRMGTWRRMSITVPIGVGGGFTTSITMEIDLPASANGRGQPFQEFVDLLLFTTEEKEDGEEE